MKKIIVLSAVVAAAIMSCAKDNTCTCTVTTTPTGGTATSVTTTYTLVETTKGQAKANCLSGSETLTYGTYVTTSTNDCKLN
jgi:hypothetical protein